MSLLQLQGLDSNVETTKRCFCLYNGRHSGDHSKEDGQNENNHRGPKSVQLYGIPAVSKSMRQAFRSGLMNATKLQQSSTPMMIVIQIEGPSLLIKWGTIVESLLFLLQEGISILVARRKKQVESPDGFSEKLWRKNGP